MDALPPIRRPSNGYLAVLLVFVVLFYILLVLCFVAAGYGLFKLVMFAPTYFEHVRGSGAIKLFIAAVIGICVFGWGLIRAFRAKVGGDPFGIQLSRKDHPKVFALTDDVASTVSADAIHEIFLTPESELGVWEEAALYMPPGLGKRKIVLGMGALSYLTLPQLRSVLAHEYGHFSNRDTFFSRFIHRVLVSYGELVRQLSGSKIQYVNPLYWLIRGYVAGYRLLASSFSRLQEFGADRFAVEAYGAPTFAEALTAAHVEGDFFGEVGIGSVYRLAHEGKCFKNLYQFVSGVRHKVQLESPEKIQSATQEILRQRTGPFDSHPSLRERLEAQGVTVIPQGIPQAPRPVESDKELAVGESAPPSAGEELFGKQGVALQHELSEMISAKFHVIVQALRQAADEN